MYTKIFLPVALLMVCIAYAQDGPQQTFDLDRMVDQADELESIYAGLNAVRAGEDENVDFLLQRTRALKKQAQDLVPHEIIIDTSPARVSSPAQEAESAGAEDDISESMYPFVNYLNAQKRALELYFEGLFG